MERQPCIRRTLASGDLATVEQCACGAVHLTIGAVTLRITASALAPVAAVIGDAARVLTLDQALLASESRRGAVA